jgi:peptide deformylase
MPKEIKQKNELVLRAKATNIEKPTSTETKKLIKELADSLFNEPDGIGIAAPQLGISKKLFLVAEDVLNPSILDDPDFLKKRSKKFLVFINPTITKYSTKKNDDVEGCLSVRGTYGSVRRSDKVNISFVDETGANKTRGSSGLLARVLQHEMDHLEGVLFIDTAKNMQQIDPPKKE